MSAHLFAARSELALLALGGRAPRIVGDGRPYLTLSQGVRDAASRWVVTHDWGEWRDEIPWMSLYFSVGVWISIALTRAPAFERELRVQKRSI